MTKYIIYSMNLKKKIIMILERMYFSHRFQNNDLVRDFQTIIIITIDTNFSHQLHHHLYIGYHALFLPSLFWHLCS